MNLVEFQALGTFFEADHFSVGTREGILTPKFRIHHATFKLPKEKHIYVYLDSPDELTIWSGGNSWTCEDISGMSEHELVALMSERLVYLQDFYKSKSQKE